MLKVFNLKVKKNSRNERIDQYVKTINLDDCVNEYLASNKSTGFSCKGRNIFQKEPVDFKKLFDQFNSEVSFSNLTKS